MTNVAIARAVLRHNGIPASQHAERLALDSHRGKLTKRAIISYRAIYFSLTAEERQ